MNSSLTPYQNESLRRQALQDDEDLDLGRYIDVLLANKWLIAAITARRVR